jgi:hypothetical protein
VELTLRVEERRASIRYTRLQRGLFVRLHQGRWNGLGGGFVGGRFVVANFSLGLGFEVC